MARAKQVNEQSEHLEDSQSISAEEVATVDEILLDGSEGLLDGVDLEELAGMGKEEIKPDDITIPRLTILQPLSPQVLESNDSYIHGAKAGMIYNPVSEKLQKEFLFAPVHYKKLWLEWAPRHTQLGIVGTHQTPDILNHCKMEANQFITPTGNNIQETAHFWGWLCVHGDQMKPILLSMASTQLGSARKLISLADDERIKKGDKEFSAPLFWRCYKMETTERSNPKGQWWVWKITRDQLLVEFCRDNEVTFKDAVISSKALSESLSKLRQFGQRQVSQGQQEQKAIVQ